MLNDFLSGTYSPTTEAAAFEAIWRQKRTVKRVADVFRDHNHALPSAVVEKLYPDEDLEPLKATVASAAVSMTLYRDFLYPEPLRDVRHPTELLYYKGDPSLFDRRAVSVVGARAASDDGVMRARNIARSLVEAGFVVMSGLAKGIDRGAHEGALRAGGRTVAVVGTPLTKVYPKENEALHNEIASEHLVVSQWPLSFDPPFQEGRSRFPERNITMSALSDATIIVEASESSGSLKQAKAALQQGRRLFILESCFSAGLEWPERFLSLGAIRTKTIDDVLTALDA